MVISKLPRKSKTFTISRKSTGLRFESLNLGPLHIPKGRVRKATPIAQKMWSMLTEKQKNELRKEFKDSDGDKVPNGADCRPFSKKYQDDFNDLDKNWLFNNKIETDEYIDSGYFGDVFSVKGNPDFVVKVPRLRDGCNKKAIKRESTIHKKLGMESQPLFTPSKTVRLTSRCKGCKECVGLVRPSVKIARLNPDIFTDEEIEKLRQKVINLSMKGYVLEDGIQVGMSKGGKPLQFDVDFIHRSSQKEAFKTNNTAWIAFLTEDLGMSKLEASHYGNISR